MEILKNVLKETFLVINEIKNKLNWKFSLILLFCQYFSTYYLTIIIPYSNACIQIINILWIPLHLLNVMLFWSFFQCIITDPGRVPEYWQMHLGEQERNRYCLICHNYKPQRCHHCNKCNRCVLNMDHHCINIGNCVGYYNSKFYLLLIFYEYMSTIFSLIVVIINICPQIIDYFYENDNSNIHNSNILLNLILLLFLLRISVSILKYLKIRINFVKTNQTQISVLETQLRGFMKKKYEYDISIQHNWCQVMGTNPWLWLLPMHGESGKPKGDGINWQRIQN